MTVRELLAALSVFDPDREVRVEDAAASSPLLNVTAVYQDRVLETVVISHGGSLEEHEANFADWNL